MEQNRDPRIENCTKKTLPSIPNSLLQPRNLFHIPYLKGHVWMWEFDYKERWAPKNWCFWTVILKKTLESPLDCKEIQPVHPKRNQCWIFIGRTDAKAEIPILWPLHAKSWLIGKDPDAGRDWGQEEKGMTEDEMAGLHHQLDGHEFGWTWQRGMACCDSWGCREWDTTELLNWTEMISSQMTKTYDLWISILKEKRTI